MIVEWFLALVHGLGATVFGWLHDHLPSPPGFWTDATAAINTILSSVPSAIRYFVPVGPLVTAGLALVGLIVALGALRLVRRILSLFTGGGGNA